MSAPGYSIIIPGFNRPEPLKYTLRSAAAALARLPEGGEIVLVDDGSTPPLAEQLAGFDSGLEVRHLVQPNQGSIVARATGLAAARRAYVLFLDSDDLIHPDKLLRHREAFASGDCDVVYDDMAVAQLAPDYSAAYTPGTALPAATTALELLLKIQPAPHSPSYRRDYLHATLGTLLVPARRVFDPAGDVWLYYNLLLQPPRYRKLELPLTAPGPHEEARYSQHWEKLGTAALLLAEDFMRLCPNTPTTHAARQAVGEAAFRSWRALPRDFDAGYGDRLLRVWQAAPRGPLRQLGGTKFTALATVFGPAAAGRWLRQRNHTYASCRTLNDEELHRLLHTA